MPENPFDATSIKQVIFCALVMSAIDDEIHTKEWDVIQVFVKNYWKKEYGGFNEYKAKLIANLKVVLSNRAKLPEYMDKLLESLNTQLSGRQKSLLLELVGNVMAADNVMAIEESDLFAMFLKKLGIQPT